MPLARIANIIEKQSVAILLGAGGVGKTTTSVAVALEAAKAGRRVGLISIDPAKRLATAMGIPLNGNMRSIELPDSLKAKGTLAAAMLDQQGVFDSMVDRFAPNAKAAAAIKAHSFYRAASQNLAGALEFMALAKLQEMVESHEFDFVVVDTPPDAHALDFLARPDSLARFVDSKVTTWMLKPFAASKKLGLTSLFSKGERLMGGIAKVAGISALQTMSEFLILLQDVMIGFNRAGARVAKTIRSEGCSFILVTAPRAAPMRAALNMLQQLDEMKLSLDAIVVNRCLPSHLRNEIASLKPEKIPDGKLPPIIRRYKAENSAVETLDRAASRNHGRLKATMIEELPGSVDSLLAIAELAKRLNQ
jgi:anion-transporting  ArsA/GET3 family ATPase